MTEEKLNNLLKYYFIQVIKKEITEEEFNKKYYQVLELADKHHITHSKEKRMDGKVKNGGRTPFKFFGDIYRTGRREFESFEKYFISVFKNKGIDLEWKPNDIKEVGYPLLLASDKPDFCIRISGKKMWQWVDSKVLKYDNLLILKHNNLKSYSKYHSMLFITTENKCYFISRRYIDLISTLTPRPCSDYNGKLCVEISNRKWQLT